MFRKAMILTLLAATTLIAVPSESDAARWRRGYRNYYGNRYYSTPYYGNRYYRPYYGGYYGGYYQPYYGGYYSQPYYSGYYGGYGYPYGYGNGVYLGGRRGGVYFRF